MVSLQFGLEHAHKKDYRVWIHEWMDTGIDPGDGDDNYGTEDVINNLRPEIHSHIFRFNNLSAMLAHSTKLGECSRDSISVISDDGDDIEGNEVGNIILAKDCSFSAELINATPDNVNALMSKYDGNAFYIILEEVNGRSKKLYDQNEESDVLFNDVHDIIIIGSGKGFNISVSEAFTGSDVPRAVVSMKAKVQSISDFRRRVEIPYDVED